MEEMQDHQLLIELITAVFEERTATLLRTGTDPGNAAMWKKHDLGCIADYFRCKYKKDIRPWFLKAGLYDPAHPPAQSVIDTFPGQYNLPCDTFPPDPPVPPTPWPPVPPECSFQPEYTIQGSVDLGQMFIGFMGPFLQGTNLYLLQSFDVNDLGTVPDGTPGEPNDIISITYDGVAPPVIEVVSSDWSVVDNLDTITDENDISSFGPGLLLLIDNVVHHSCPEIEVTVIEPGSLTLLSTDATVAALNDPERFVHVRITTDGVTWMTVTTIPETALVGGIDIQVDPNYLGIAFEYVWENGLCTCPALCPFADLADVQLSYGCPVDCLTERIFQATIPSGWRAKLQMAENGAWVDTGIDEPDTAWSTGVSLENSDADFYRLIIYNMSCTVLISCVAGPEIEFTKEITTPCITSVFTVTFTIPTEFAPGFEYGGVWVSPTTDAPFEEFTPSPDPGDEVTIGPFPSNTGETTTIVIRDLDTDRCPIYVHAGGAICT